VEIVMLPGGQASIEVAAGGPVGYKMVALKTINP